MRWVPMLSLALLAGGLAPGRPLSAQLANVAEAPTAAVAGSAGESAPASRVELRKRMARAERYAAWGNYDRARRDFEWVISAMQAQNTFAYEALWQLAGVHLGAGHALRAAATLDELARSAEMHQQVSAQATALLEAAKIYEREGRLDEAVERLHRATALMDSPALTREGRVSLLKRIRG